MTVDPSVILEAWPKEQLIAEVRRLREELARVARVPARWHTVAEALNAALRDEVTP